MELSLPKDTLNVPPMYSLSSPMAVKTCDGSGFDVEHAEPADAQIPYLSNSNNNSEPFTFLKLIFAFPGNLSIKSPFILILSISFFTLSI